MNVSVAADPSVGDTISERLDRHGGVTTGFDYLRIGLAISVVLEHSVVVTDQLLAESLWSTWPRIGLAIIMPAFFALSGFLVAGSLLKRNSLVSFVTLRVLRLAPALAVEVLLSALVIGPLLTTLPLSDYFSSPEFWRYFRNLYGDVQFILPGLFAHNPFPDVINQSIWTIPFELDCYILLALLSFIGFIKRPRYVLWLMGLLCVAGTAWLFIRYRPEWRFDGVPGRGLVLAFLTGVALNLYGQRIRLSGRLAAVSLALGMLLLFDMRLSFLAVIPIAYATIYVGLLNPKKVPILMSGDYSYGIYLFAFPIQQAEVALMPGFAIWYDNAAIALIASFAYAAMSWWFVERPILSRRAELSVWVDRRLHQGWNSLFSRAR